MSHLFEPFTLKSVTLRNRIVAAPMCMYSVTDGLIGEWHHTHLEQLAVGGAGLVTVEMTDGRRKAASRGATPASGMMSRRQH